MSFKSVYVPFPDVVDERIRITEEEHRHLAVARVEKGEEIEIFDGNGNVWQAAVDSIGKKETIAKIKLFRQVRRDTSELILGMAMIRTAAFEWALEKAVETGVNRIIPFVAARSNVQHGSRSSRWMRIIIEAAKQSKRYHLPVLEDSVSFEEIVQRPAASKILFAERDGGSLKSALAGPPVLYLIGPEGGWTDSELILARKHEFRSVSLGTGILKAETAAIAGAVLIRYKLGL
jgi:16S rRNA (uracil1498-N3)-methyltransferase